ncbi:MAG TPA: polymer-forming cytoskeletal protein [Pyrinomonadaceae bacterium]
MNAITYDRSYETGAFRALLKSIALVCTLVCGACVMVCAQSAASSAAGAEERAPLIVDGNTCKDVFGVGQSVIVRGNIQHGALAFGGDVIVEGRVEGDVATIGGSVIQREGSYIGGDVLVFGGTYHHGKDAPGRNPASATVMYAGYEDELRELARNPVSLLAPHWTPKALGLRVLAVLFWFIVSLALTAATPGAISRAATRLQLTSLRVAVIGLVGALVIGFGVPASLAVFPPILSTLIGALALLLVLVAYLFGRVAIHAATGRWLQRTLLAERHRSESVALLLGTIFWVVVLSLPYVWVMGVGGLLVTSLGLALTARYRLGWRLPAKD